METAAAIHNIIVGGSSFCGLASAETHFTLITLTESNKRLSLWILLDYRTHGYSEITVHLFREGKLQIRKSGIGK